MPDSKVVMTKTERNLWNAIIGEAMALLKYNAFAVKALEEGHPEVAQIFQETAGAENIHGMNHLRTAGAIKSSMENLASVVQGEAKEISTLYPRMIKEALDEGRRDAARAFTVAMDRERYHLESFLKATDDLRGKLERQSKHHVPIASDSYDLSGDFIEPKAIESDTVQYEHSHITQVESEFPEAKQEVEKERLRVAAFGRIREVVFGAQDGLMSTLALVTAISAAVPDKTTVVIAGLAGAIAGMISMATGAYLGSKAEKELFQFEIEKEAKELDENPAEEMAELVFLYHQEGMSYHEAREMAEHVASDRELWLRTLVEKELGINPDLASNPLKDALTMGGTFVLAALVPIIPYLFIGGGRAIGVSAGAALAVLFALGMAKGRLVQKSPVLKGLEILAIGAVAAGLGWFVGEIIPNIIT